MKMMNFKVVVGKETKQDDNFMF